MIPEMLVEKRRDRQRDRLPDVKEWGKNTLMMPFRSSPSNFHTLPFSPGGKGKIDLRV